MLIRSLLLIAVDVVVSASITWEICSINTREICSQPVSVKLSS